MSEARKLRLATVLVGSVLIALDDETTMCVSSAPIVHAIPSFSTQDIRIGPSRSIAALAAHCPQDSGFWVHTVSDFAPGVVLYPSS